jgi:hypothetical protein
VKDPKRKLVDRLRRTECGLYCRARLKRLIQNTDPTIGLLLLKNQTERKGDHSERRLRGGSTGSAQTHVTLAGLYRPSCEMFRVFNDVYGHFIEGFECLFVVGSERFHALFLVETDRFRRDFEVEPALMDDAEEGSALVESVPAEHRAAGDDAQIGQLIQHIIFETVVSGRHGRISEVCAPPPFGRR